MIKTFVLSFVAMLPKVSLAFDTATIEQAEESGLAIAAGGYHSCVLAKTGVICWGDNQYGQLNVPVLSHPSQISAGVSHTCVLDDSGVKCWGSNDSGQLNVPALSHPRQISAGAYHNCALDDDGVKCWGDDSHGQVRRSPRIALYLPELISAGVYRSCALDDSGVKCWGDGDVKPPLALWRPSQITNGEYHTCAMNLMEVLCWGNNYIHQLEVPKLSHARQISAGFDHTCALDESGVTCWGRNIEGQLNVPSLSSPRQVSSGKAHSCALDDSGVTCWGSNENGQLNVPDLKSWVSSFDLDSLETSYKNLSPYVYRDKKLILENIGKTISRYPVSGRDDSRVSSKEGKTRLFSMYLIENLLDETYSDFIQNKILPKLRRSKDSWSKKLAISNIQEIELSSGILEVSFTLIGSGLQASKNYLSVAQQKELENLMAAVAQAKAVNESSLSQSASQLLTALDQHQGLLAALLESERTIGFGKMILEIQGYLKGNRSL